MSDVLPPNPMSPSRNDLCCKMCGPAQYGTPGCPFPSLGGWAGANIDRPGGDYQNFDLNGAYPTEDTIVMAVDLLSAKAAFEAAAAAGRAHSAEAEGTGHSKAIEDGS
jgi:hypothetical protein